MRITENNSTVLQILNYSKLSIGKYLNLNQNEFDKLIKNINVKKNNTGINSQLFFVDFYENEKHFLNSICIKYSSDKSEQSNLNLEAHILKELTTNTANICPRIIDFGTVVGTNNTFIIMSLVNGKPLSNVVISIQEAEKILDLILTHEKILLKDRVVLDHRSIINKLHEKIDYRKKILLLLGGLDNKFKISNSLRFLNYYLNHPSIIKHRKIITDRSSSNFLLEPDDRIKLIDFSTIRAGSIFDNWIQFIDDPRSEFSCSREQLIDLFFEKNNKTSVKFFQAASVYTCLLQGIFSYKQNQKIGNAYFEKANKAYSLLKKNKVVQNLISEV